MILSRFLSKVTILLFIITFNSCELPKETSCDAGSIIKLDSSARLYERIFLKLADKDSLCNNHFRSLNNLLTDLKNDLIHQSGGIAKGTDHLYDGCRKGTDIAELFNESLKKELLKIITEIEGVHKDKNHFYNTKFILDQYFFAENKLFNESYVSQTETARLCSDVITLQIFIYGSFIDEQF